jgi:hypothetical protein
MSTTSSRPSTSSMVVSGTSAFAGIMLCTVAVFGILQGIAAIASDKVYVDGIQYTYQFDITTWGWIHLVLGIIALGVGIGILADQSWALVAGIAITVIGALGNFAFMPYYPLWSLAIIALDVFIIWALCQKLGLSDLD